MVISNVTKSICECHGQYSTIFTGGRDIRIVGEILTVAVSELSVIETQPTDL